ncbi:MAG: hypothetical protein ABJC09_14955, partial [Terriglobia bacterium]
LRESGQLAGQKMDALAKTFEVSIAPSRIWPVSQQIWRYCNDYDYQVSIAPSRIWPVSRIVQTTFGVMMMTFQSRLRESGQLAKADNGGVASASAKFQSRLRESGQLADESGAGICS